MEIFCYTLHSKEDTLKTGIYKIYHTYNPSRVYIGSASRAFSKRKYDIGFLVRWKKHLTELKNNKHANTKLQRIINKHGISGINFEIIEFCESEKCLERENYYINLLNSVDKGYNIRKDSHSFLGMKHSQTTIEKIRKSNAGKILSKETKEKIAQSKRGKSLSEQHILKLKDTCTTNKPRYCYNKNGELVYTFFSCVECERFFGFKKNKLWEYIKHHNFIKDMYLVFNEPQTQESVLNIISAKKEQRRLIIEKINKIRLSKKIPC